MGAPVTKCAPVKKLEIRFGITIPIGGVSPIRGRVSPIRGKIECKNTRCGFFSKKNTGGKWGGGGFFQLLHR